MDYKNENLYGILEVDARKKMMRIIMDVPSAYFSYDSIKDASIIYEYAKIHGKRIHLKNVLGKDKSFFHIFVYIGIQVITKDENVHVD